VIFLQEACLEEVTNVVLCLNCYYSFEAA
jgi:hypothetical protein